MSEREVLRELLDDLPYGASALGRDAGVSARLLRMIRSGDRRLTSRVRDALTDALRRRVARLRSAIEALESLNSTEERTMTTARREALMGRAERYAADEMGWTNAEAVDARLDPETNLDAVLIDPGARRGGPGRFVVAFDQWGRVATDAGAHDEFGWDRPDEEVAGRE